MGYLWFAPLSYYSCFKGERARKRGGETPMVIRQERMKQLGELAERLRNLGCKLLAIELQDKFEISKPEVLEEFQKLIEMAEKGKKE